MYYYIVVKMEKFIYLLALPSLMADDNKDKNEKDYDFGAKLYGKFFEYLGIACAVPTVAYVISEEIKKAGGALIGGTFCYVAGKLIQRRASVPKAPEAPAEALEKKVNDSEVKNE